MNCNIILMDKFYKRQPPTRSLCCSFENADCYTSLFKFSQCQMLTESVAYLYMVHKELIFQHFNYFPFKVRFPLQNRKHWRRVVWLTTVFIQNKQVQGPAQAMLPALEAILGHRSAHSLATGPVMAEPADTNNYNSSINSTLHASFKYLVQRDNSTLHCHNINTIYL